MYGVPANLDLTAFNEATLIEVGLGEFIIQLRFHPVGTIGVEGGWELRDANGSILDTAARNARPDAYRVHVILGKQVKAFSVTPPHSFSLEFETGHVLTIFDDSQQFESFSIQPGNIFI